MMVTTEGADLHYEKDGEGPVCFVLSAIGTEPYRRMMPDALRE